MRRSFTVTCGLIVGVIMFAVSLPIASQAAAQTPTKQPALHVTTPYPDQSIEARESVTLPLKVRMDELPDQIVHLRMSQVPNGWSPSFIGNGQTVQAVFASSDAPGSVRLKLDPPQDVKPGTYQFAVVAQARTSDAQAELSLSLKVQAPQPPQLSFNIQLPTLQGTPDSTITYKGTVNNDGERDLTVNLSADAPDNFQVTFKERFGGKEVSRLPVPAGESKDLDIELNVPTDISAGTYTVEARAASGGVQETQTLRANIQAQPDLTVSSVEGPYSTSATMGQATAIDLAVRNNGSAPAEDVTLNASPPSGWTVEFEPSEIGTIPPDSGTEVTARVTPSDNTIAGDYFVTLTADAGGSSASREWRVSAKMSTVWGAVGIVLIAVALGVVGIAVVRYGRR